MLIPLWVFGILSLVLGSYDLKSLQIHAKKISPNKLKTDEKIPF